MRLHPDTLAQGMVSVPATSVVSFNLHSLHLIVKGIIEGRQPIELTAESLMRNRKIPTDWRKQRRLLGFAELTASE